MNKFIIGMTIGGFLGIVILEQVIKSRAKLEHCPTCHQAIEYQPRESKQETPPTLKHMDNI